MNQLYAPKRRAGVVWFDKDRHGAGCTCGLCNSNGHSYGYAVYDFSAVEPAVLEDKEALSDLLYKLEPIEVVYAPSAESAEKGARMWAMEKGFEIVI